MSDESEPAPWFMDGCLLAVSSRDERDEGTSFYKGTNPNRRVPNS